MVRVLMNYKVFSFVDAMLAAREVGFVHLAERLLSKSGLLLIRLHSAGTAQ